jgi:hypothetical protein
VDAMGRICACQRAASISGNVFSRFSSVFARFGRSSEKDRPRLSRRICTSTHTDTDTGHLLTKNSNVSTEPTSQKSPLSKNPTTCTEYDADARCVGDEHVWTDQSVGVESWSESQGA